MKKEQKNIGRNKSGQFTDGNNFGKGKSGVYKSEYCSELIKYFEEPPTRVEYIKRYDASGNVKEEEPIVLAKDYPTFEGFAIKIGVTARTLEKWVGRHKAFAECYERAKDMQKNALIVNSLGGRYNSSFAKFIAVNHHGMSDKVTNEHEFEDSVQIKFTYLEGEDGKNG